MVCSPRIRAPPTGWCSGPGLPANTFFGAWALTDAILPAIVAGWLLALIRFADTGGVLSRRADRTLRLVAGAAVAATAGIALASTAALPDEHRVGNYAYGRYLSCFAVPLALAGAALLIRAGRRGIALAVLAAAGAVAGAGLAVVSYAGPRLHEAACGSPGTGPPATGERADGASRPRERDGSAGRRERPMGAVVRLRSVLADLNRPVGSGLTPRGGVR